MLSTWDGFSELQRIEFCKKYLLDKGYHIWGPVIYKVEIKTIPQLVRFFYDTMAKHRTDVTIFHAAPSKADRGTLSNLVKSRMALGMNKKRALAESCLFIEKLFEYEMDILGRPVTSPRVLGQDKMAWLTERVWLICEGYDLQVNSEKNKVWFEDTYSAQEQEEAEEEVRNAISKMDKMLESGTNNGK